jgi:hypothetical protein
MSALCRPTSPLEICSGNEVEWDSQSWGSYGSSATEMYDGGVLDVRLESEVLASNQRPLPLPNPTTVNSQVTRCAVTVPETDAVFPLASSFVM